MQHNDYSCAWVNISGIAEALYLCDVFEHKFAISEHTDYKTNNEKQVFQLFKGQISEFLLEII